MMNNKFFAAVLVMCSFCIFFACKKKDPTPTATGFDKTAMLTGYADELIIPEYKAMTEKMTVLNTAVSSFLDAPSAGTQAAALAAYKAAHMQYSRIAPFQFGPAETALLDLYINFSGGLDYNFTTSGSLTGFSVDTATIEQNIVAGSYDLTSMQRSSFYAQGFPALDYLLFAPGAITALNANKTARSKYVNDVLTRITTLCAKVSSDWTAYRTEFIANTKTNVGSPIGNMVNQLAYGLDVLKGPCIGWPFGKQSNGIVFADKCEGYYAGISVALAAERISGLKNVYSNKDKGIGAYLVSLNNASLNTDVLAQFDVVLAKLNAVPDPLSTSLTAHSASVDEAYKEIQKLLTLIKTDVASATAVQITFMDNDGD